MISMTIALAAYLCNLGLASEQTSDLLRILRLCEADRVKVMQARTKLEVTGQVLPDLPLARPYPYLWLIIQNVKVCLDHRVRKLAVVNAVGLNEKGEQETLGFAVGERKAEAFWLDFIQNLTHQGLGNVKLICSDNQDALIGTIKQVWKDVGWQHYPSSELFLIWTDKRWLMRDPYFQLKSVGLTPLPIPF